jgi:YVTN family beta-propeller protein
MGLHVRSLGPCLAALAIALIGPSFASGQTVGPNVNMVSGTQWPGGDPFLQRQNEPSVAVSSRNPFHLLAGANDYRSVDLALTTNGETGDAWLGLFKSLDGGATWRSILLPGCPYNTPICGGAPAVRNAGYQAAADPTVRAGTNGMFYYAGLVFNRGFNPHSAIVVSRLIDLNNKENADPNDILNGDAIQYIGTSIVANGSSTQFLDKPAMAVDIPRGGATTCNLAVNQPGNGQVHQSFAAGNVYVAYTAFSLAPNTDPETVTGPQKSRIYFVRSEDCGATWSRPVAISGGGVINQSAVITISPVTGIVYVGWRQFHYQAGSVNQPDAMVGTASFDGGENFAAPVRVSTFTPFDEGTTNTSFRTNAYPTAAVDGTGRVYVAYSARNVVASGDARIVMTTSLGGTSWTPPIPVDNPAIDPINNPLGRGHQIMPALTFAAGRLSLLYYDLRLDHTFGLFSQLLSSGQPTGLYSELPALAGELGLTPPLISAVFNAFIDDSTISLRRHTFDLRVAQALPGKVPLFAPSVLVSQYAYGCCAANQTDIEQLQFNVPNLPIFRSGTAPFMGDYLDIAASPSFIPPHAGGSEADDGSEGEGDNDKWTFNIRASTPTTFHAAWTDNRDVQAPANGDWTKYTPPNSPSIGSTSIFQPGTSVPACQVGFTGSRNQNIYTAPISGGLVFGAPGNTKRLGTTVFNGQTVPFQRAFSVVAQNATNVIKSFRLTIANQPGGGNASFLQFAQLTTLDVSIPALSSATRPIFVTSTNPTASVTVNIAEITAPLGTLVPGGLTSFTTLNPDATNPAITNPAITNPAITNPAITNFEVTNPAITNPAITNPAITNPAITNPAITNPAITNSTFQSVSVVNPAITNPAITNPAITNASIANPAITNPAITNVNPANTSVSDTQWTATNTGNTEGSFAINLASSSPVPLGNVLQLIISKLYQTPAAPTGQDCNLKLETHNVVVTNIVNPVLLNPTNPAITNPGITNPAITNATVALAPGETANIIIRVVNTDTHTFPTFNPAASVAPVVVSQAVPTLTVLNSGGGTPPPPPVTVPPLQITTISLPDAVTGAVYASGIQTVGGNPTAHSFSLTSGALPTGLSLDPVTGAITGLVTASGVATFSFSVQVQDVGSPSFPQHTATQSLSIRVGSRMVFSPLTLPSATQGTSYSQNVTVTGGIGTIVQTIVGGSLPPGLTFSALSGLISGIPTASGPFSFTIQAADSAIPAQIVSQGYTINVVPNVQVPANVTFVTQPGNSVGGQALGGSPVIVQVSDNSGAAIPNAPVVMSFGGTPPCSAATLSGTLSQTTNAQGQATFSNLSIDRGQFGYTLRATSANATAVSNPFAVNGFCGTATLSTPRESHTQILLTNGKVLIAGGLNNASNALNTAELYDPTTGTVSPTGNLTAPNGRARHASVVLPNGHVLLVGGADSAGIPLATAELYDPASGVFSATGSMAQGRDWANAVLLANGKILVSGGLGSAGQLNTAELYDPATGVFTPTGNLNQARARHMTTLLPNGTVLLAGGRTFTGPTITVFASAEIFDPIANNGVGAFASIGNMNSPRVEGRATLLPNGTVLLVGGFVTIQATVTAAASSAEIFDPAANTFTLTGSMSVARAHLIASLLQDGTVLVAGGVPDTGALPPSPTADIFNPSSGTFSATGVMTTPRQHTQAVVLLNSDTLVAGGDNGVNALATTELYFGNPFAAPFFVTTTSLPNGIVNQAYTRVLLQQGGGGALTWTLTSGSLPAGITLGSNGVLSGTATAIGSFPFTVQVVDSSNPQKTATATLALTIVPTPSLVFTSATMPTAVVGQPYIQALPVAGGTQPYNATVTTGTLPPGLGLSSGGVLNGTPSGTGNFTFTVTVTDSSTPTKTATQTFTMSVNTLVITTTVLPNGIVGVPYNATIATAGGTLPLSFFLTNTAFPPGLFIQQPSQVPASPNGALAGTPTLAGTYTFSESVVDHSTPVQTATQNYVVTIAPAGSAAPANVTFVSQPQNSVGGQLLSGGPVMVRVTDAKNTPVPGTTVAMSFNGAPPCSVANLGGTLTAVTDGTGQATFSNLAIDRGQFGYSLLASTGSASAVSGPFSVQGFCASGNLSTQREEHTQVLLGTGKVLLAGGIDNLGNTPNTAELYDPATGTTSPTGNLSDPNGRAQGLSVVLQNGKVLLIGGGNNVSNLATAELYDPATGTFTATGSMSQPRFYTAAVLLADGRVLVSGGFNTPAGSNTAEIYDPATGLFTLTGNMTQRRGRHAMTLLPNGKVLVTGGRDNNQNFFALSSAEIFDPFANQGVGAFTPTGNMNSPRHVHTATLLSNGTVLVAGGFVGGSGSASAISAETFDPATNVFTLTGNMNTPRSRYSAALLPDGSVLQAGGVDRFQSISVAAPAELYSPTSRAFSLTGPLITGREFHRTTVLPNGNALLAGGDDGVNVLASTELYYSPSAVSPLIITTSSVPNGTISQRYVQILLEQGGLGTLTWSQASGTLPTGVTLGTNGILSGTPTSAGSFTFTVQVTDSSSPARTATSSFTINVSLVTLAFTSNTMPAAGSGKPYSQPLPVTGGTQPYNATLTGGALPTGLSLSTAGILSGTPSGAGSFTFTATVTDSSTPVQTATQTLTIAVNTLSIITTALPGGIVGVPYNATITTVGGTLPLSFSAATAAFPPGLTIQQPAASSQSGALLGTPTLTGHYTFSESVSDSSNPAQTATQYYLMDVSPTGTSVPATVTFLTPPQNSVGGQILGGSPIRVHVADANNVPIIGASVAISFNGAPPCSSAVLSGTLNGVTGANGNAGFPDLSIDRGQLGYTLLATTGNASAVSQPFTVNGFCNVATPVYVGSFAANTLLSNGKALITGGIDVSGNQSAAAQLYDPTSQTFTSTGSMQLPRREHTSTLLADGRVLVTGGRGGTAINSPTTATAEIYDPVAGTFTSTATPMNAPRRLHTATALVDGTVLLVGGLGIGADQNTAEIFDPKTNSFTLLTATLAKARETHTATLLPDGTVLIAGGSSGGTTLSSAEIYNPSTRSFAAVPAPMNSPRSIFNTLLLPTGQALLAGGIIDSTGTIATSTAEVYDPASGTFKPTGSMSSARSFSTASLLANGQVLVAGGAPTFTTTSTQLATAEVYDSASGTFSQTGSLSSSRAQQTSVTLNDGTVLVTQGAGGSSDEIYYSTTPPARHAYVPISSRNVVTVLDVSSNLPVATIPVGAAPFDAAVSPNGSFVYVDNSNSDSVSVINPTTNTVVATIPVGSIPAGIAITPDSSTIYVATHGDNSVSVINAATNSVIKTVAVGSYPFLLASTPDGKYVYVPNAQSASVSVLSTATNSVIATIPVGLMPQAVAVAPDGKFAYVTCTNSNLVYVVDTATNTVVKTIPVSNGPLAVSITPDGTTGYVSEYYGAATAIINLTTNTVVGSVPVGGNPYGSAITPDGAFVWQTSWSASNISVISIANNTVIATIPVSGNDFNVAITPK